MNNPKQTITRNSRNSRSGEGGKDNVTPEKKGENTQDTSGLGKVVMRNEFYRDGYRMALRIAVLQSFVIIALIAVMFFVVHVHQPENRYFATTEDGRVIPMVPLNQPNLSPPALVSWAAQAATETLTFGFNDYRRRLQESSRFFTQKGWESFSGALKNARILEMVEQNTQIVTAVPAGAPVIAAEGVSAGRYQWRVEMPMVVTYQSGSKSRQDRLVLKIVITRVSRLENPNGLGISQWVAIQN